jgi:hypothetical protein
LLPCHGAKWLETLTKATATAKYPKSVPDRRRGIPWRALEVCGLECDRNRFRSG